MGARKQSYQAACIGLVPILRSSTRSPAIVVSTQNSPHVGKMCSSLFDISALDAPAGARVVPYPARDELNLHNAPAHGQKGNIDIVRTGILDSFMCPCREPAAVVSVSISMLNRGNCMVNAGSTSSILGMAVSSAVVIEKEGYV